MARLAKTRAALEAKVAKPVSSVQLHPKSVEERDFLWSVPAWFYHITERHVAARPPLGLGRKSFVVKVEVNATHRLSGQQIHEGAALRKSAAETQQDLAARCSQGEVSFLAIGAASCTQSLLEPDLGVYHERVKARARRVGACFMRVTGCTIP